MHALPWTLTFSRLRPSICLQSAFEVFTRGLGKLKCKKIFWSVVDAACNNEIIYCKRYLVAVILVNICYCEPLQQEDRWLKDRIPSRRRCFAAGTSIALIHTTTKVAGSQQDQGANKICQMKQIIKVILACYVDTHEKPSRQLKVS
jgi:hypothetical protein